VAGSGPGLRVSRRRAGVPPLTRLVTLGAAVIALAALGACRTPAERALSEARRLGFEARRIQGDPYPHVLLVRTPPVPVAESAGPTTVYLDGDADPGRVARRLPIDATPRHPVALELMALDPGPCLYLGRPGQLGAPAPLEAWSVGRYGDPVVHSLLAALQRSGLVDPGRGVVLVGFSGGGTLAALLAERLPGTRALVTVAGNLDVAAWTRSRGEPPLTASLDPADRPPLPARIVQIHLQGSEDRQVPGELASRFLSRQVSPSVQRIEGFDHDCCWASIWPDVLARVRSALGP